MNVFAIHEVMSGVNVMCKTKTGLFNKLTELREKAVSPAWSESDFSSMCMTDFVWTQLVRRTSCRTGLRKLGNNSVWCALY